MFWRVRAVKIAHFSFGSRSLRYLSRRVDRREHSSALRRARKRHDGGAFRHGFRGRRAASDGHASDRAAVRAASAHAADPRHGCVPRHSPTPRSCWMGTLRWRPRNRRAPDPDARPVPSRGSTLVQASHPAAHPFKTSHQTRRRRRSRRHARGPHPPRARRVSQVLGVRPRRAHLVLDLLPLLQGRRYADLRPRAALRARRSRRPPLAGERRVGLGDRETGRSVLRRPFEPSTACLYHIYTSTS